MNGGEMYRTVFEYASLGAHHRTGTPEDAANLDWFESKLRALDAHTERHAWSFDRYDAEWSLTADGREIESLPLFYEGVGEVETASPALIDVPSDGAARLEGFREVAGRAMGEGAMAAVVFTGNGLGDLLAINRAPTAGSGLPTLCVGRADHAVLSEGPVRLSLRARVTSGASASIVGRIGDAPDSERLLLTTPLSGWFRCAGERGTGIAVLLAAAEALADRGVPLLLNGNSGHELEDYGAHRLLETGLQCRAIFHVGASVAAGEPGWRGPGMRLSPHVRVRAWAPGRERGLSKSFKALGCPVSFVPTEGHDDPKSWSGESRVWCRLGKPVASFAGTFSLFHTSGDTPARATTPELLEASCAAVVEACDILAHA